MFQRAMRGKAIAIHTRTHGATSPALSNGTVRVRVHAAELAAPLVERRRADAMSRHSCGTGVPASACLSTARIWLLVNRDFHRSSSGKTTRKFHFWRQLIGGRGDYHRIIRVITGSMHQRVALISRIAHKLSKAGAFLQSTWLPNCRHPS